MDQKTFDPQLLENAKRKNVGAFAGKKEEERRFFYWKVQLLFTECNS